MNGRCCTEQDINVRIDVGWRQRILVWKIFGWLMNRAGAQRMCKKFQWHGE